MYFLPYWVRRLLNRQRYRSTFSDTFHKDEPEDEGLFPYLHGHEGAITRGPVGTYIATCSCGQAISNPRYSTEQCKQDIFNHQKRTLADEELARRLIENTEEDRHWQERFLQIRAQFIKEETNGDQAESGSDESP